MPPAKIGIAWPHVAQWVSEALARGNADQSPEDVRQHLDRGTMQLWLAWDDRPRGCCITEVVGGARGRACNLVVVAGDAFRSWGHLVGEVERWAAGHDCVRLTMTGRKGWARRLAGEWQEIAVTLERRIGGNG